MSDTKKKKKKKNLHIHIWDEPAEGVSTCVACGITSEATMQWWSSLPETERWQSPQSDPQPTIGES